MWLAQFDSRSFSWLAAGRTEQHAIETMLQMLAAHSELHSLEPGWYGTADISTTEIKAGDGFRDYTLMIKETVQ